MFTYLNGYVSKARDCFAKSYIFVEQHCRFILTLQVSVTIVKIKFVNLRYIICWLTLIFANNSNLFSCIFSFSNTDGYFDIYAF